MERRLAALLPVEREPPESVHGAMRHALLGPGKRLRPVLTLAVAELLGAGDLEPAVDLAAAIELVHAGSLVLDDLPAMDDAELRRGRPATHRAFGEGVALLAAFALLNQAYALVAEAAPRLGLERRPATDLVTRLAGAIGPRGLIGGQALDLECRPAALDRERLTAIHARKTGALFVAAAELGALAADAAEEEIAAVSRYALELGVAFQIADDLRDAGTGRNADRGSLAELSGAPAARRLADERLAAALTALAPFGGAADPLRALAEGVGRLASRGVAARGRSRQK